MLEDILQEVKEQIEQAKGEEEFDGASLFNRKFLRRLATLSSDDYQRFKDKFTVECFLLGVKVRGVPSDSRLDRMVQAVQAEMKAEIPDTPVALRSLLPDAPHDGLFVSARWHMDGSGLYEVVREDTPGIQVVDGPLYVGKRLRDIERNKETLVFFARVDGEWRRIYVAASANAGQIYKAVTGAGLLVSDRDALERYVFSFRQMNRKLITVELTSEAFESLFDRWSNYVFENSEKFTKQLWGRLVTIDKQECLAVYPEKLEAFLKKQGASLRPTLNAWRKDDLLVLPEKGFLHPVWANNRTRRMVVFSMELLSIQKPSPLPGINGSRTNT